MKNIGYILNIILIVSILYLAIAINNSTKELSQSRKEIPLYLDRLEQIVSETKGLGKAVTKGIIRGVIETPIGTAKDVGVGVVDTVKDVGDKVIKKN